MDTVPTLIDETSVAVLTIGDLKKLIESIVDEKIKALEQQIYEIEVQMPDPDEGKTLKPTFIAELEEVEAERQSGKPRRLISLEEVSRELGLDD